METTINAVVTANVESNNNIFAVEHLIKEGKVEIINETNEVIYLYGDIEVMEKLVNEGGKITLFNRRDGEEFWKKVGYQYDFLTINEYFNWYQEHDEVNIYQVIKNEDEILKEFKENFESYVIDFDDICQLIENAKEVKKAIDKGNEVIVRNGFFFVKEFASGEKATSYSYDVYSYILGVEIQK